MEHRLCHHDAGNNLNAPGAAPTAAVLTPEQQRDALKEQSRNQLFQLQPVPASMSVSQAMESMKLDPAAMEELKRLRETKLSDRWKQEMEVSAAELARIEGNLGSVPGEISRRIQPILKALRTPLPTKAGQPHPYGTAEHVNFRSIEDAQKLIHSMQNIFPDAAALNRILNRRAQLDTDYNTRQFSNAHKNSPATKAVNGFLQMTLFLGAGAAVILTGVPAIGELISKGKVEGKSLVAPALAAAVFGFIGNADFRRSLFASTDQNLLVELNSTINNKRFTELCKKYDIQGGEWAQYVGRVMKEQGPARHFGDQLAPGRTQGKNIKDERKKHLSLAPVSIRPTLEKMIDATPTTGDFTDFIRILGSADKKETQAMVSDFVRSGATRYVAEAQDAAAKIDAANR